MYSFLQLQIMESLPEHRQTRGLPWLVMTISFYSYLGALQQPAPTTHGNNTSLACETSVCTRSMRAGHCLASSLEETYKAVLGSSHLTDVETVEGNLPRFQYYPRAGPGPSPGHLSLELCPNPLALITCSVSNRVCSPKSFSLSPRLQLQSPYDFALIPNLLNKEKHTSGSSIFLSPLPVQSNIDLHA